MVDEQRTATVVGGEPPKPVSTADSLKAQIAKLQADLEAEQNKAATDDESKSMQELVVECIEHLSSRMGNPARLDRLVTVMKGKIAPAE